MEKVESLTIKLEEMISEQNLITSYNKKLVLDEIITFLTNLQKITEYFIENVDKNLGQLKQTLKINPANKDLDIFVKDWDFYKETGLHLPIEKEFEKISYHLESTKHLFNQDDVLDISKILKDFEERYFSYDDFGNLKIVSSFTVKLASMDIVSLETILKKLKNY